MTRNMKPGALVVVAEPPIALWRETDHLKGGDKRPSIVNYVTCEIHDPGAVHVVIAVEHVAQSDSFCGYAYTLVRVLTSKGEVGWVDRDYLRYAKKTRACQ